MESTGVFASQEEAQELLAEWNQTPIEEREPVIKKVHEAALKAGLPEIEGWYGLSDTGEFLKSEPGETPGEH